MTTHFRVLLGGDHVGKSSLLRRVGLETDWRTVAHDGPHPLPWRSFVSELRNGLDRSLSARDGRSSDFAAALVHVGLVFLRDTTEHHAGDRVLVDSYHYKVLAKCILKGIATGPLIELWRSFPAPSEVILLGAEPEVLWERSGNGRRVTAFECYGSTPTRDGFLTFQRDLADLLRKETHGLRVRELDASGKLRAVGDALISHLGGRAHARQVTP
jgi:hypothetical protein